jgi:hypothetical protein
MTNKNVSPNDKNTIDMDAPAKKLKGLLRFTNRIGKIFGINPAALRRIIPFVSVTKSKIIPDPTTEKTPVFSETASQPVGQDSKINLQTSAPGQALSSAMSVQFDSLLLSPKDKKRGEGFYPFRRMRWLLYLSGFLLMAGEAYYIYVQSTLNSSTFSTLGLCFLLAFIWLMIASRNIIPTLSQIKFNQIRIHPVWLFVLVALVLRYYSYSIFPPVNQTGFEELETGAAAYRILFTGDIPVGFRFTNLIGALGLITGSGLILSSLRFPFQIMGMISLILLVFSLRSLKVSWMPILLVVFIAATMRFLVIASGVADELFTGISILTASLLFVIKSENSKTNQSFWLAAAGICAGILMFEYTSYRMYIVVIAIWLFLKCVYKSKAGENDAGSSAWFNLFSFVVPLILVALPTFVQTIRYPVASELFEAFFRHDVERSTIFPETSLFQLINQVRGLTGWLAELSVFYTPVGEPVLLPPVGWLFGIGFLFSLFFMGNGLPRVLAVNVFLTIVSASFFANNLNIGRMSPTFPMLLVMSGIFLEKVYQKIIQWMGKFEFGKEVVLFFPRFVLVEQNTSSASYIIRVNTNEGKEFPPIYYRQVNINMRKISRFAVRTLALLFFLVLIFQITRANLNSLKKMSKDPQVINEYVNDDYSVCAHIGAIVKHEQRVYIYSTEGYAPCSPHISEGWYFGDNHPEIHHVSGEFISPTRLVPGDMVVMGASNRGLTNEEISQLVDLGSMTNSLASLQFSKNAAGRITAASICFQCDVSQ